MYALRSKQTKKFLLRFGATDVWTANLSDALLWNSPESIQVGPFEETVKVKVTEIREID